MDYRLVFDIGSKVIKCAIADENHRIIHWELIEPKVNITEDGFGRSWDEKIYWNQILQVAAKTISLSNVDPQTIRYISACSIRPSCVFTDEKLDPLYIGASFDIIGMDYGEEIEDKFQQEEGKSFYESSGNNPAFLMIPSRLAWIQDHRDLFHGTIPSSYLPLESWLLCKFGAEIHTNYSSAAESGFFDLNGRHYPDAWYSIFNLKPNFFPFPVKAGEVVGNISGNIQEKLNLHPDTELVAGLPDTQAALLGANCLTPQDIGAVIGSTTPVQAITRELILDKDERTWSSLFAVKHLPINYILEANTGITGQVITWGANLFADNSNLPTHSFMENSNEKNKYEILGQKFAEFDQWEVNTPKDRLSDQMVIGNLGPTPLASSSSERAPGEFYFPSPGGVEKFQIKQYQLVGAVYDNILFAVYRNIEYLHEIGNITPKSVAILGGVAQNSTLVQRFADLSKYTCHSSPSPESSLMGLLTLCDIASGKLKSIEDLKRNAIENHHLQKFQPRQEMSEKLLEKYKKWLRITHN
ncbi:MAG: hypothetical protein E4G98_01445 [Promethearchaeota archaeon]|nr:MAG: hypothetical protein E4G98_01445 [Candidatus Lokiarchaeota archaeon]